MMFPQLQTFGTFSRGKKTQTAGTVIVQHVPPLAPTDGAVTSSVGQSTSKPNIGKGILHVTDFVYNIDTTAHTITIMRPLNYTWLTADAAASQAVVNIAFNPGTFQTAGIYQYPLPNGRTTPSTANNNLAGSDYVLYQAAAGQWVLDTVASISSLAVTLTTNLPTGGALKGALLYFFGITTDVNPANNEAHQQLSLIGGASTVEERKLQSSNGVWHGFHAGDPMVFHSSNETGAGTFNVIAGYWSRH